MQIFRELFSFLLGNFWIIHLGTFGQFTWELWGNLRIKNIPYSHERGMPPKKLKDYKRGLFPVVPTTTIHLPIDDLRCTIYCTRIIIVLSPTTTWYCSPEVREVSSMTLLSVSIVCSAIATESSIFSTFTLSPT